LAISFATEGFSAMMRVFVIWFLSVLYRGSARASYMLVRSHRNFVVFDTRIVTIQPRPMISGLPGNLQEACACRRSETANKWHAALYIGVAVGIF
jgi:hypothetical protein